MKIPTWLKYAFLIIALIGFADASYLTVLHFQHARVGCLVFAGCDAVTGSEYATIGPVPMALLGMGYYLVLILGTLWSFFVQKERIFMLTTRLTIFGFLFSIYFVSLQAFVIKAFCSWCLISAAASLVLFILGAMVYLIGRKKPPASPLAEE